MPDKVIAATLQVNTGSSNENIKEVNKNLNETEKSLQKTSTASKNTTKDIKGAGGAFGNLKESLSSLPGPLGAGVDGVGKLNTSFKALLANPIGITLAAIVAVLFTLYKAFTNTFQGAQKVEQVFAGLKAAAGALFDNLDKLVSAALKFITLDFSGAAKDLKSVGDAALGSYDQVSKLTAVSQQLKKEQLQNDLEAAERQKKLAILREQADDPNINKAERKAALLELKKESEQNAKDDIDLARRTAENKIALLSVGKDGALKNAEEINQIKIQQINGETENANELRRIGKQITAAEKEEAAERKAAQDAAAAKAKEERAKLIAFNKQLLQLQQQNELAIIKEGYDKELKQLEIKLTNEKKENEDAVISGQLTRLQGDKLNAELDKQFQISKDALDTKKNEENLKQEADFQKELAALKQKLTLSQITDSRQLERTQLQIEYEEKLNDAITRYKDDAIKFAEVKAVIDAQLKADQDKLNEKFRIEDEKKKLEKDLAEQQKIIDSKDLDFQAKRDAVDAEQALIQAAFDNKVISEEEYTKKVESLATARMTIAEQEAKHKEELTNAISGALGNLSSIAGKQTAVGKALAIAQTAIDTYTGAIAAYKSLAGIPIVGPALGAVAAAAAIKNGIDAVKKITAVQVPGGGGGGGTAPSLSVGQAAPVAPSIGTTQLNQQSLNQMGNATVRAYVVDHDAQTNREKNERLNRAARLGG